MRNSLIFRYFDGVFHKHVRNWFKKRARIPESTGLLGNERVRLGL